MLYKRIKEASIYGKYAKKIRGGGTGNHAGGLGQWRQKLPNLVCLLN